MTLHELAEWQPRSLVRRSFNRQPMLQRSDGDRWYDDLETIYSRSIGRGQAQDQCPGRENGFGHAAGLPRGRGCDRHSRRELRSVAACSTDP
jgi:hypothetical protein